MRTARSSPYRGVSVGGGLCQGNPWIETLPGQRPPRQRSPRQRHPLRQRPPWTKTTWTETPQTKTPMDTDPHGHRPPGQRPPDLQKEHETRHRDPPRRNMASGSQRDSDIIKRPPSGQNDWHMPVKILPCSKLRSRVVNIENLAEREGSCPGTPPKSTNGLITSRKLSIVFNSKSRTIDFPGCPRLFCLSLFTRPQGTTKTLTDFDMAGRGGRSQGTRIHLLLQLLELSLRNSELVCRKDDRKYSTIQITFLSVVDPGFLGCGGSSLESPFGSSNVNYWCRILTIPQCWQKAANLGTSKYWPDLFPTMACMRYIYFQNQYKDTSHVPIRGHFIFITIRGHFGCQMFHIYPHLFQPDCTDISPFSRISADITYNIYTDETFTFLEYSSFSKIYCLLIVFSWPGKLQCGYRISSIICVCLFGKQTFWLLIILGN